MVVGMAFILDGPCPDRLLDAIWSLVSPDVFVLLTEGRGWSSAEAASWLVAMTSAAIDIHST
jgi:hypothetical protein